jgi:hypothetical protein
MGRILSSSLRWYYPVQVRPVGGSIATLSARFPRAPESLLRLTLQRWSTMCQQENAARYHSPMKGEQCTQPTVAYSGGHTQFGNMGGYAPQAVHDRRVAAREASGV